MKTTTKQKRPEDDPEFWATHRIASRKRLAKLLLKCLRKVYGGGTESEKSVMPNKKRRGEEIQQPRRAYIYGKPPYRVS